jgi:SEC-C motif-containing protein
VTLCIAGLSPERVVVAADRRLTAAGKVVTEERAKLTFLETRDARGVIAYSGLAETRGFRTDEWLLDTLFEIAPPHFSLGHVIEGLRRGASDHVRQLTDPSGRRFLTPDERRLSFYFAGYGYPNMDPAKPRIAYCFISNWEGVNDVGMPGSRPDFAVDGRMETRVSEEAPPRVVLVGGMFPAVKEAEVSGLGDLLGSPSAPDDAVVRKAVHIIRAAGARSESRGTIGDDVLTAVISPDPSVAPILSQDLPGPSGFSTAPNVAMLTGATEMFVMRDARLEISGMSMRPHLGRNDRCWCGSGLKHKRCHGR